MGYLLLLPVIGRHSQVGKAAVCKTPMPQFESGCRLFKPLYPPDRVAFFMVFIVWLLFDSALLNCDRHGFESRIKKAPHIL